MSGEPRHLVVGRLRKPHGLKGEFTVFPLTDDPATVFQPGRALRRMDLAGTMLGEPVEVERSKAYHREWLIKFRGVESRDEMDLWRGQFLAAPEDILAKPAEGEVYLHELEGFAVKKADGSPLGLVSGMYEMPSGLMLEVQGPKREFVKQVNREGRVLVVELPEGLVEL